jgi:hypothetical protein
MSYPPQKMKTYESFSDWRADQSTNNQLFIDELRKLIQDIAPHLTTSVKWGQGCWLNNSKPVLYIHAEANFVQLGFFRGSSLNDPDALLKGNGKYIRHIKIEEKSDIDVLAFTEIIEQVVK